MSEDLNRYEVMSRRFQLAEEIALLEGRHKLELEPLKEELLLCERFVHDSMVSAGEQQFKTSEGHMAFFTTQNSCKVTDWDATLAHIIEKQEWELLNHAVNKTVVTDYITANQSPPPGVAYKSRRVLSWHKGKS
ncbi:MAG: hypothetical protein DDT20_00948 [Firmicutes bacterium]|nr:hypothetical protein [Bacillota bacterium]